MNEHASRPIPVPATHPSLWQALRARLVPQGANILMLSVYIGIIITMVSAVLGRAALTDFQFHGTIICLSAMLALNALLEDSERWLGLRRAHVLHLLVNGTLMLAATWLGLAAPTFLPYLLFMLIGQAIVMFGAWRGLLIAAVLYGAWLAVLLGRGMAPANVAGNAISVGMGVVFTALFCSVILGYSRQREQAEALAGQLRRANGELAAARQREQELAVAQERLRLARDIHDGLGHHLTVLNVQLQAAAKLIERDPARAAAAIATSREVAQAAMDEVRQSVAAMRRTPLDGRTLDEALAALVREFDARSPLSAAFALHGALPPLAPSVAMTLYRAAQEGLTNAQKHAAAQHVAIELRCDPPQLALKVSDDGRSSQNGKGFGLAGLRERAELLGGTLSAGPRADGGFELCIELPV
ncbi:MAG: sensor histidine kinase [Roseiflexaceae bacterium]|nr:sensor histidine kinase [Roseiflexaceae bacterium]